MSKGARPSGKKAEILAATATLLSTRGAQALSFENVAHQAGFSRQLVRYYYSDVDVLIADMCDYLANCYREILVAGIVEVGQVGRLKFFLDFFFDLAEAHPMPMDLSVYDAMIAFSVGSDLVRGRMCDQYQTLGQVIEHELAIAHPELGGAACRELSFIFVSMMHAHWSFVASLGYSRQHSHLARQTFDRLIRSYLADTTHVPVIDKPWALGS